MPISFAGLYSQNFDSLASAGSGLSWTNDLTLAGWSIFRQSSGGPVALTSYNANNGSSNSGAFISYGPTNGTDRALGGLGSGGAYFGSAASGSVAGWFALALTNTTGAPVSRLDITFNGEQWRNGGNAAGQTMVFQRGYGNSFQQVSNWLTPGGTFNWSSPVATTRAAAVEGNTSGRVSARGGTLDLSANPWAPNSTLWLRWAVNNQPGEDHGLAIDDLRITAPPVVSLALSPATVAEDGAANLIYTFSRTGPTTSALTVFYTVAGSASIDKDYTGIAVAGTSKSVTFLAGNATATVTVDPTADTIAEPDETVDVILAAGSGYTVGTSAAVVGTIRNDDLVSFSISPSASSINEGSTLTTTFTTRGLETGTTLYWALSGTGINAADFSSGALSGSAQLAANGSFSISHGIKNDQTSEGDETLEIKLYSDVARSRQVGSTASVKVVDSSRTPAAPPSNAITTTTTINASIDSRGEVDSYTVDVGPGTLLRASLSAANASLFPLVELKGLDGAVIKNPVAYNGNSADLGMVDLLTGKAIINVRTQAGGLGNYNLSVSIFSREELRSEVYRLTNSERSKAGLAPLSRNNLLEQAAEAHVRDMDASDRYLAHTGSNGSSPTDRIKATGYKAAWVDLGNGTLRTISSENAAAGQSTPAEVVQAWMNSSGHRAAILDPATKDIGVGFDYDNEKGTTYWVQNFGYPWSAGMTRWF